MAKRGMLVSGALALLVLSGGVGPLVGSVARAQGPAGNEAGQALPIHRLTLYRSGVASVERRGQVTGDADVQLRFRTEQINDILKSMIVLDLSRGQGSIEGVSYASQEPLARRLSSFGIDIGDNPSAGEILQRLRGTRVRLALAGSSPEGVVMNVEKRPTLVRQGEGTAVVELPWINLVTGQGVRSYNLVEAGGFEILDSTLAGELDKALAALAEHRADRTKAVDVRLRGQGAREIVVAYVQEAPAWKTSYRLVLPDLPERAGTAEDLARAGQLTVQGWAIVENTTDDDWNDVRLGLVAGRPVSFRMDLYEPLYVSRPELPVPSVPGVMPKVYSGGFVDRFKDAAAPEPAMSPAARPDARRRAGLEMGTAAADMAMAANEMRADKTMTGEDIAGYGARARASAVEAGEVFQLELDAPVSIPRQRSAMLPIVSSASEGRRVSIYNASDGSAHPMKGVELRNTTPIQLMPGPISVFDGGTYAGDAQIGHVSIGDKRLLAYAVDLDVETQRTGESAGTVRRLRIVDGLLEQTVARRESTIYKFANKDARRARQIVVEHPRLDGWELTAPAKASEATQDLLRFDVSLDAGGLGELAVTQERVEGQRFELLSFDAGTLMAYAKDGKASQAVADAFREASRRQGEIFATQRQIAQLEQERGNIGEDQKRIRENIRSLDRTNELYARYVETLNDQETRLGAIAGDLGTLNAQLERQRSELAAYVGQLNVE